jgi:thiamine biosynthesis lipoprotein
MPDPRMTRRRALLLLAGAGGAALAPAAKNLLPHTGLEWRGTALGAHARMIFLGADRAAAEAALAECLAEIERLEQIFSLHRPDAEIVCLNADGRIDHPSLDLEHLLRQSLELNRRTEGLFDPTVQPLWRHYAKWFAGDLNRDPPPPGQVAEVMAGVGMGHVRIARGRILLDAGTNLTLNGIAQGYITDRVAALLRRRGFSSVLADIGEVAALGARPDGTPFEVAVEKSDLRVPLANGALATSSVDGLVFSGPAGLAHLLHPRTGATPSYWRSITVRSSTATLADGLSTALILARPSELRKMLHRFPGTSVWATQPDGRTWTFSA